MAFQIIKISNFLWKTPPDPLAAHPIGAAMIHGCLKNIPILHTQKKRLDSLLKYYQWRLSPNQPRDLWSLSCGNDVLNFSCLYSVGDTHKYMKICFTFFKTICLKKEIWQKVMQSYMIIFKLPEFLNIIKMKSIRKSSNSHFQWIKTLYQNI